jgi:hypothetical protein
MCPVVWSPVWRHRVVAAPFSGSKCRLKFSEIFDKGKVWKKRKTRILATKGNMAWRIII